MTTLATRDQQALWRPTWVLECAALPHTYAIRDVSILAVPGGAFTSGSSDTGGTDEVGGASGPDALHAWGRLVDLPTVERRIADPFWPVVDVQDVRLKVAAMLSGDYAAQPFTLSRYDEVSGLRLYEFRGIITRTILDRDGTTIEGTSVDRSILEAQVPVGTVTTATFPNADSAALGKCPTWLFGNVTSLPLLNVNDDVVNSRFDYLVCRGDAAAITALRRLNPAGGAGATVDIAYTECEPYPGEDGVLENGGLEDWDSGTAVAPTGWTLSGASATVAKDTTNIDPLSGNASAAVTRVGTDCDLRQGLSANAPASITIAWWQGRSITLTVRVRATVASRAFVRVSDGFANIDSGFHTGGGGWETLTATGTINAAATLIRIVLRVQTGNTTVQFDSVHVQIGAKSWDEIPRPDLYDGYTAIRFFLRQDDANDQLYQIVADSNGLQPERNPVRAMRTILSDATHGVGRTVDAGSFDTGEIAACLDYTAAILLDGPEVFLPFRDAYDNIDSVTQTVSDLSGHARNGVYHLAGAPSCNITVGGGPSGDLNDAYLDCTSADGDYIEIQDSPAFSSDAITVRAHLFISAALPDAAIYPIVEKLIGATTLSGYALYRENSLLKWAVRGTDTNLYTVTSSLSAATDRNRWIDIICTASGGVLKIYRDGPLAATGSYSSALAQGTGVVRIGLFGTGSAAVAVDQIDNVAIFSSELSAARIAAQTAAIPLAVEAVGLYDNTIISDLATTFYYVCGEVLGDVTMTDAMGAHSGAWTGGPALGQAGPLNHTRGFYNGGSAVRMKNNAARYGVETGMTLADAAATVLAFYRPDATKVNAGICEKTVGGVMSTQWGLCQRRGTGAFGVIRFTFVASSGTYTLDAPMVAEDLTRYMWIAAQWQNSTGTLRLWKNGELVASTTYTGTASSGVGDFYVGIQGTSGGVLQRPGQGYIGRINYHPTFLSADTLADLWTQATWYNGGALVDAALTEPRQAQDWLGQIGQLLGIRLGFTAAGAITASVDATAPAVIQYDARDGAGDGDRSIVAIGNRQKPSLEDRVRDVVVKYRRDLVTGEYLGEIRREVSTLTDAQGNRIGRDRVFECEGIREHPTADRFADRAAKLLLHGEDSVEVTLHQEARRLMEGDLVQVTDALMDYSSEVMRVREVRKALATIGATVEGYDAEIYTYTPSAFPAGATSG